MRSWMPLVTLFFQEQVELAGLAEALPEIQ
jgi:hypothetical protein